MADQAIYAPMVVLDANGLPVAGARASFYATGTNTLIPVYTDQAGSTLATNPVIADGAGYLPQRYFDGDAKVVIQTPDGETLWTIDPVPKSLATASGADQITFSPTTNIAQLTVQSAIVAVDTNARTRDDAKQATSATLTSISDLTLASGDLIYGTGVGAVARLGVGANGQVLGVASGLPAWRSGGFVWLAKQVSTSGTALDFTGIPAWATEIAVALRDVSLSGTDNILIQIGTSSGPETSGYVSTVQVSETSFVNTNVGNSAGFDIAAGNAANAVTTVLTIHKPDPAVNEWIGSATIRRGAQFGLVSGYKALSAVADRIRITRTGTDTFDGGYAVVGYR